MELLSRVMLMVYVASTQENKEQDSKEAVKVSTDILVKLRLQILIGGILSAEIPAGNLF